MSRWMSVVAGSTVSASFSTVIRYLPGYRPTWMYSPFLLVLVSIGFGCPCRGSRSGPSRLRPDWPLASMTLPLICPLCANAGAATHARPKARAQDRDGPADGGARHESSIRIRIAGLVYNDLHAGGSLHRRDVGDEVLADRTAAGGPGVDRPAGRDGRGPAARQLRAAPRPAYRAGSAAPRNC